MEFIFHYANHGGCHYPAVSHARMAQLWQDRGNECGAGGSNREGPHVSLNEMFSRVLGNTKFLYVDHIARS